MESLILINCTALVDADGFVILLPKDLNCSAEKMTTSCR